MTDEPTPRVDELCDRQDADFVAVWECIATDKLEIRALARQLERELAIAQSRLAEVEEDAARYRWMREHFRFSHDSLHELWFDENVSPHAAETICDREALDAAIDEAIKRSSASSPS